MTKYFGASLNKKYFQPIGSRNMPIKIKQDNIRPYCRILMKENLFARLLARLTFNLDQKAEYSFRCKY